MAASLATGPLATAITSFDSFDAKNSTNLWIHLITSDGKPLAEDKLKEGEEKNANETGDKHDEAMKNACAKAEKRERARARACDKTPKNTLLFICLFVDWFFIFFSSSSSNSSLRLTRTLILLLFHSHYMFFLPISMLLLNFITRINS